MAGRKEPTKKDEHNPFRPNVWGMTRDIFIQGMNKGQLLMAGVLLLLVIFLVKLPPNELLPLCGGLKTTLVDWAIWGWVSSGILVLILIYVTRTLRKGFSKEMNRVGKEKSKLQKKATQDELSSSDSDSQ